MFVEEIHVENFGPIGNLRFKFYPNRINIVTGENASGKTQLLSSIYSVLFDDAILQYHEGSDKKGLALLRISDDNKSIALTRHYSDSTSQLVINNFEDIKNAAKIDRTKLFFCFPELDRSSDKKYSRRSIQESIRFILNLGLQGHHILGTCQAKTEIGFLMTIEEQRYLDIICLLSGIPNSSVVIGDCLLSGFDAAMRGMVLDVIKRMENVQFILAEDKRIESCFVHESINLLTMPKPSSGISPASYNYKMIPKNNCHENDKSKTDDAIVPVSYCFGEEFTYGECRNVELKEIKGQRICETIAAHAEIYINAFLNSASMETGKIFWGVNDKKIITGVKLSYRDTDTIRKKISEALSQAEPFISPDLYNIKFNKIASPDGNILPQTYVVEVDVYPHIAQRIYSTSKGEVFIKTPGGKKKLSNIQVQELLLMRLNKL